MKGSLNSVRTRVDTFSFVRKQLEKLGYNHPLSPGSLPLLNELTKDLMVSKEKTEIYKQIIRKVEKEKRNLEKRLIPYQKNNGKLALENNDLHKKLIQVKQDRESELKEFNKREREKNAQVADLEFIHKITLERVKELERNNKLLSLANKNLLLHNRDGKVNPVPRWIYLSEAENKKGEKNKLCEKIDRINNGTVNCKHSAMNRHMDELLEELEELKLDNQHQSDIIAALKCQVTQKEREICRLRHTLENGRSATGVSHDCCHTCKQKDCKIKSLEKQLEEAVEKQHEAMSRALHLAERNQHLERELKDIDHMALAVEEDCHNKVKNNMRNMDVMEEKLRQKMEEIKKLEDALMNMKNKIECDELEFENLKREKQSLEKNLNAATSEKKHLNEKINYYLLIEKNLNSEISRMQEINKSLQRQICDMEERVMDILETNCKSHTKEKQRKRNATLGLPSSKTHSEFNVNTVSGKSMKGNKKFHDEEINECFHKSSSASLLDKIQKERDYYHNECHRLKDQLASLPCRIDGNSELSREIKELKRELLDLRQEKFTLICENSAPSKRFDSCSGDSIKIILDRLEKERDMALADISRLQGEREALRERLKLAAESQIAEQSRFEKIVKENEERIRRLENERRELISSQSSQRFALANMEEKYDEYKENIRKVQSELAQMKANYCQLKALQEQTDRSLSESQSRNAQTEIDLRLAHNEIEDLRRINANLEDEICLIKKEKTNMLSNIALVEKEKDGLLITLDEKTEKVAKLENHIKKQDSYIRDLNGKISCLEKKFELTLNERTNREYGLRSFEREVERLKEELERCELQKESLIRENRRLQDDLTSAAKDCMMARRDLEAEKKDVENLKKQLQQYVTEVKRAEELLTKKEGERNQMLEHFRSLSIEASTLETNNQTLESTVENTKSQLISAENRIADLEHQIASKDSLLYNYEKQIAELSTQTAELETKLKQETDLKMGAVEDLSALRDLCSTLDVQKETLKRQASNCDAEKIQLMNEVRRLSEEYEGLSQKLNHEKTISQTLEKSLSNSRQETLEHKINNKDLQAQVQQLKQKVDELTRKLESESLDVRRYQSQCSELSQQVNELRREVTNARFEQAKAKEDTRRSVRYLKPDSEEEYPCSLASSFRSLPASTRTFTWSPEGRKRAFPLVGVENEPSSNEFSYSEKSKSMERESLNSLENFHRPQPYNFHVISDCPRSHEFHYSHQESQKFSREKVEDYYDNRM